MNHIHSPSQQEAEISSPNTRHPKRGREESLTDFFLKKGPGLTIEKVKSPINESPQIYARNASSITETKTIITSSGHLIPIVPIISSKGNHLSGSFSKLYEPAEGAPQLFPGANNDQIVIKILKPQRLQNATSKMEYLKRHYLEFHDIFKDSKNPPLSRIFNIDEATTSGYTIEQKASHTFEKAPWSTTCKIKDLNPEQTRYFTTCKSLIKASNVLKKKGFQPDLKWNNLGIVDSSLVLLDYVHIPFTFSNIEDSYAKRLSGGNPHIEKELRKYENTFKPPRATGEPPTERALFSEF